MDRRLILVTAHRRESFGEPFENICHAIRELAARGDVEIVYPVHLNPNVQEPVQRLLGGLKNVHLLPPASYPQFVWLMDRCRMILTDSGGVQEEAPSFGIPILVLRECTERPENIESGAAELVRHDRQRIVASARRLIEDPGALYITFDNVEVGRLQAAAVYEAVPTGNYVFIKGNAADANADFVHSGQLEVLQDAIDAGDIVNVGESYTDNWDPAVAQQNMEQFLTDNNNDVQAVVSSNDGMAGGVVAALEAQGLAGSVAVSGQDGDQAALNRVALGTQTVSVWKDARELGTAAGEAADGLARVPLPFGDPAGGLGGDPGAVIRDAKLDAFRARRPTEGIAAPVSLGLPGR